MEDGGFLGRDGCAWFGIDLMGFIVMSEGSRGLSVDETQRSQEGHVTFSCYFTNFRHRNSHTRLQSVAKTVGAIAIHIASIACADCTWAAARPFADGSILVNGAAKAYRLTPAP